MTKKRKKSEEPRASDGGVQTATLSTSVVGPLSSEDVSVGQISFSVDKPSLALLDDLVIGQPVVLRQSTTRIEVVVDKKLLGFVPKKSERAVRSAMQKPSASARISDLYHQGIEVTVQWAEMGS